MKLALYTLALIFLLNACQAGRGMPIHPSMQKPLKKSKKPSKSKKVNTESKEEKFPTLKLKGKSLAKKGFLLSQIPIVNTISTSMLPKLSDIPILRDVLPTGSEVSKKRLKEKHFISNVESFSGGLPVGGLDIGMVRLGQSSAYTRLIFDTYYWEGYAQLPVRTANDSGTYIFTYEPKNRRITAILDGYQAFSALVGNHEDLYVGNNMVKTIHLDEYLDKSGFKFTIELKQEAKIRVYELHNPARIIIDMAPLSED